MNSNGIFVSLDIGTSTVKMIIGEMSNDALNIIGVGNVKSEGLKKGSIVDIDHTVQSIRRAVEQAERMVGMEIRKVIVGIPCHHISLIDCHGVVAVSGENREITNEDVLRVIDAAQVISIPPEREIINVIQKQFIVDSRTDIHDPRGMIGVRLEMEGLLVTGSKTVLLNILRSVEKAGLEIVDIVLQPLASGEIAISQDEKNLGSVLVDIGGGSTSISYFEDGYLQGTSLLPIGGDNITKDLSIVLRTTTEAAEQIKVKYGHAFYELASADVQFSYPVIGSNQQQQTTQMDIAEIIEARLEETFFLVQDELRKMGVKDVPGGYVLTGGTANIDGILELAQSVFQNRVRIGIPDYIGVREPQYTTAVGIIKYAYKSAKMQGKLLTDSVLPMESKEKRTAKSHARAKENVSPSFSARMKQFFGSFFE
jgi:cell division protein FtsA